MPKKFLKKIIESMSTSEPSKDGNPTKKADLMAVSDAINSVNSWDQLDTGKYLIINFIKKHKVRSESPEFKYLVKLFNLRKIVLKAHRMDEGDDDIESHRLTIIKILKEETADFDFVKDTYPHNHGQRGVNESLNWDDKDESWSNDESWGSDPNWVQGDTGGSDSGSSDSGGGDYDSFMGEDDDFGWAEGIPSNVIQYEFDNNPDIEYIGIDKSVDTPEDMTKMLEVLSDLGYEWTGTPPDALMSSEILWVNREGRLLRGTLDSPLNSEDMVIDYPFAGGNINEVK